jgi:hypothetical protein
MLVTNLRAVFIGEVGLSVISGAGGKVVIG